MLISYNWLKSYIEDLPEIEKLSEAITFHLCEIEGVEKLENGDYVLDLNILPDRAHYLLSHQGVASEVASMLGLEFKLPEYKLPSNYIKTNLKIDIENQFCRRYIGRIVRGVKVGPSPEWMVKYLLSVGQRSINNIVDATNIVMLDCGQPIHAFDLAKLDQDKIVVRNAKEGEEISLVGREQLKAKLKDTDMMITDGEKSLAIAGVKGGLDSGVSDETKDIFIEVANFEGISVRKTARRLAIHTDASKRYENNLSPSLCGFAMNEITSLVLEMCPDASFEESLDIYNNVPEIRKVYFSSDYISEILGVHIFEEEINKILKNYNYEFSKNDNKWEVTVPTMRLDIIGPHDMVEEIGRVYGYDKVPLVLPVIDSKKEDNQIWQKINLSKSKLVEDGYTEVMTSVFTDKGEVEIMASASDKNFLRINILDGLKKSYEQNRLNAPLLDLNEIKLFEVGTIFTKSGEQINVAYIDKKNNKEIPLDEFCKNTKEDYSTVEIPHLSNTFKLWSVYPFITRDISVWVPEGTDKEKLKNILIEEGGDLLIKEPYLFDSFTKDSRTSLAHRLVFQSYEKTLKDDEIEQIMQRIIEKINQMGFEVR